MLNRNNILIVIIVIVLIIIAIYWKRDSKIPIKNQNMIVTNEQAIEFKKITAKELNVMLTKKDFILVDVHIPEQVHIPKTDYVIPYTNINTIMVVVPDKNAKIVLYCRSGMMSSAAAQELIKRGYTNVYDLTNGMNGWLNDGLETVSRGTIPIKN